ncbi:hypothetical protein AVEN_90039-1 [Araneus ventricosus]|uniref:Uncharacterized protein n=1 Tax=Araneus ventricosus TaxID=182803 RepID=A0A4Y2VUX0_ARAVE|nr:hypothetical protein AVEN_90039-1 [Araneus ventricosus]
MGNLADDLKIVKHELTSTRRLRTLRKERQSLLLQNPGKDKNVDEKQQRFFGENNSYYDKNKSGMQKRGGKDDEVFVDTDEGKIQAGLEPELKWWEKDS